MLDGFLHVNKPLNWTSHDVVQQARKALDTKKIGHLGTLDPRATGVLVLAVGNATKLIEYLVNNEKEYDAEITLGEKTETYDSEGETIRVTDKPVSKEVVEKAVKSFIGEINQMPPAFSAKKVQGETAYKKARRGENVELKPKKVNIYDIQIQEYSWPTLKIHVHCGTGTYIRSLAHDIGETIGCGAYLSKLVRTRVRHLPIDTAIEVDDIAEDKILSIETALPKFPKVKLTELEWERVKNGQGLIRELDLEDEQLIAGMVGDKLISIMVYNAEYKTLRSRKLIAK